jgi:hypothetical protein
VQSVQRKSGQPSFKTLDSTIQTLNKDTGKREAITYRSAAAAALSLGRPTRVAMQLAHVWVPCGHLASLLEVQEYGEV